MYEVGYCSLLFVFCERKLTTFSKDNSQHEYDVFSDQKTNYSRGELNLNLDWPKSWNVRLLSLVLICRRHTGDIAAIMAWDAVTAYVNIYRWVIIYPRHRPPACLRSWAEFNFASFPAKLTWVQLRRLACEACAEFNFRQAGSCWRWKYFMWTSPVTRLKASLQVKWLRIVQFDLHRISSKFDYIGDSFAAIFWEPCVTSRKTAGKETRDPLEQIVERC